MAEIKSLLYQDQWRIIDQSGIAPHFNALESFAIDDTLCQSVGSGYSPAVIRTWVHADTVVLGIQDTKLPQLEKGLRFLEENNMKWVVRNSGGLAVLLDEGVLNISLIFPDTERGIDINRGYDAMWELVKIMFQDYPYGIEAREIIGSYCPGSYDLSIRGKKFAGISQRRIRKGVAVQVYLCVSGSGIKRAELLKQFYTHSKFNESMKYVFPAVQPGVMASLSELLNEPITVTDVTQRLLEAVKCTGGQFYMSSLQGKELEWYPHYFERMVDRNRKFMEK
ncbi:biotin/lipoate A/B protein ligase family protein [Siminovitchia sp. 179-K 8D1 HS]|uniref:lipoate--protein ligase family protein n=1 Tax=Siminovitchia sp. 179-K 8D1 HS TaxID=3142385 RepID=UPI0039A0D425